MNKIHYLRLLSLTIALVMFSILLSCKTIKEDKPPKIIFMDVDMIMPPAGTADMSPDEIGRIIDRIKTSSIDLEPWGKGILEAFWEKGILEPGDYDIDIYVYYYST